MMADGCALLPLAGWLWLSLRFDRITIQFYKEDIVIKNQTDKPTPLS
jgi:hypothetical protein